MCVRHDQKASEPETSQRNGRERIAVACEPLPTAPAQRRASSEDEANHPHYVRAIPDRPLIVDLDALPSGDAANPLERQLLRGRLDTPTTIDLDLLEGKMYRTDSVDFGQLNRIERANLDGSGREVIASGGFPWGIAVVPEPSTALLPWLRCVGGEMRD